MVSKKNKGEITHKKSTITSSSFAEKIRQEHDITREDAKKIVKTFLNTIEEGLIDGKPIILSRIGTLYVTNKPKGIGVNPQNGEKLLLSERRILKFKKSVVMINLLNAENPRTYELINENEIEKNKKKP